MGNTDSGLGKVCGSRSAFHCEKLAPATAIREDRDLYSLLLHELSILFRAFAAHLGLVDLPTGMGGLVLGVARGESERWWLRSQSVVNLVFWEILSYQR